MNFLKWFVKETKSESPKPLSIPPPLIVPRIHSTSHDLTDTIKFATPIDNLERYSRAKSEVVSCYSLNFPCIAKSYSDIHQKFLVLLIDENPISKYVLEATLNHKEYLVEYVPSVHSGLAQLFKAKKSHDHIDSDAVLLPDIVIIDMHTINEDMDALTFVKMVRQMFSIYELPILVSVSSKYENAVFDALELGANDYVIKPIRARDINFRIRSLVSLKSHVRKDNLLHDILPAKLIDDLEHGISPVPASHDCVTLLFSDICNYTIISSRWHPKDIINLLNTIFSAFDDICVRRGVFKVETIGDAYMIASGHDGNDLHASTMLEVALEMLAFVRDDLPSILDTAAHGPVTTHENSDDILPVSIRIGIHTGPAYSGMVGKIRPRYCFFGDTVNTASRMESNGEPGCVHLSQAAFDRLEEEECLRTSDIECLGLRDIKGKGKMQTYLLRPAPEPAAPEI